MLSLDVNALLIVTVSLGNSNIASTLKIYKWETDVSVTCPKL